MSRHSGEDYERGRLGGTRNEPIPGREEEVVDGREQPASPQPPRPHRPRRPRRPRRPLAAALAAAALAPATLAPVSRPVAIASSHEIAAGGAVHGAAWARMCMACVRDLNTGWSAVLRRTTCPGKRSRAIHSQRLGSHHHTSNFCMYLCEQPTFVAELAATHATEIRYNSCKIWAAKRATLSPGSTAVQQVQQYSQYSSTVSTACTGR